MKRLLVIISFLWIAFNNFSQEYSVSYIPNPKENSKDSYVSNPDGIISKEDVIDINNILKELEQNNGTEIAVVALNSISDKDIFDFGVELFNLWKIGKKDMDNGILILFVLDQKKIRFETGYGIEGILPDAICKRIQMTYMIPYFKEGNYSQGIKEGLIKVVEQIQVESMNINADSSCRRDSKFWVGNLIIPILVFIIFLCTLYFYKRKISSSFYFIYNSERYDEMQKAKTHINSIMVLVFIVFAAIVDPLIIKIGIIEEVSLLSYAIAGILVIPANIIMNIEKKRFRRQPIVCSKCNMKMRILNEKDDDKYLTITQIYEEKINSIDYDVFLCNNCGNSVINKYKGKSNYEPCPKCNTNSFIKTQDSILKRPTYSTTGLKLTTFHCSYCNFDQKKQVSIPNLVISRGGSGGSGGSSSSIGGSFGGGRSGGGGATSSW